jgi:hypothetical protein
MNKKPVYDLKERIRTALSQSAPVPKMQEGGTEGEKLARIINPKNWFVKDYTKSGDFNTAFYDAKSAGEEEFIWNNKRYSTKSNLSKEAQMKSYGITDEQRRLTPARSNRFLFDPIKRGLENLGNIDTSWGYNTPLSNIALAAIGKNSIVRLPEGPFLTWEKNKIYQDPEDSPAFMYLNYSDSQDSFGAKEQDALRLYLGLPQRYKSFKPSRYKEGAFEIEGYNRRLPEIMPDDDYIEKFGQPRNQAGPLKPMADMVMGKHTVRKGKDERGEYIEYMDKFDFDTYGLIGEFADKLNKPFEIYGRKYYKDYGEGVKKQMQYTDKELMSLDPKKKNFDTLALQEELYNRGYDLKGSITKEGDLDGILGEDTINALLDWQSKNKSNISKKEQGGMAKFDLKERINKVIQEGGNVSAAQQALGYKDNSPYKNMPYQDIYSDRITMQGVSQPLAAVTDNGISTVMQPGGEYYFPGANVVREVPVMRRGGLAKALGYMPTKFQNSGNTSTSSSKYDENDGWIREILTFESTKGNPKGGPHDNFGYNLPTLKRLGAKSPENIDQAIAIFKEHYLPQVLKYPLEDRKRIADMLFNANEDARVFQLQEYLGKTFKRNDYTIRDVILSDWMDENHPELRRGTKKYQDTIQAERERRIKETDKLYEKYGILNLPEEERIRLLDKGRDFYYRGIIPKGYDSKTGEPIPNDSYDATWKYRISDLFQPKDKRPDYIKNMYAKTPDLDIQPTQQRTAAQPAAPVNQGAATNAPSSAPAPVNTNVRQQNTPRETYAPGRGIFNVAEMPTTNETFTNRRGVETLIENRDKVSLGTTLSGISIIRSGDKVFLEKDGRVVPTNINAQPSKSNAEVLSSLSNGRTTDEAINNAVSILWNDNRSNYSIPSEVFYGDVESNYPNFRDIKSGYEKNVNQNNSQLTEEEQSQLNRKETLDLLREAAYNLDIHNKFDQKFTKEDVQRIVDKAKETRTNLSGNIVDLLENNDIDSVVNDLNNTESLRDQFGRPKRDTEKAKQVDELAYKDYYEKLKKYAEDNGIEAVKPEDRAGLDRYLGETKQKLGTTTAQSSAPAPVDTNVKPSTSTAAANQSKTTTTPTSTDPNQVAAISNPLEQRLISWRKKQGVTDPRLLGQINRATDPDWTLYGPVQSTQSSTQSTQRTSAQGTQSVQGAQSAQTVQGVQGAQTVQSSPSAEGDYIKIKPIYAKDPYEYRYNKTTGMWETKQKIKQTWIVLDDSNQRYIDAKKAIVGAFKDQIPARNINDVIQSKLPPAQGAQGVQSTQGIQSVEPNVAPIQGVQGAQTVKPTTTTTYWVNGGQINKYSDGGDSGQDFLSGAATGAKLGTMLLPGIGTGIGAAAGALFGGLLSNNRQRSAEQDRVRTEMTQSGQNKSNLSTMLQLLSKNNSFTNLLQGPRPQQNTQPTPSYFSTPYTGGIMSPGMAQLLPPPFQDGAQVESPIYTSAEQPTAYSVPSLESNFGGGNQKPISINMDKIEKSKGSRIITLLDPKTNKKRRAYIDANGNIIGYLEDEETNKQGYDKTIEETKDYADKQAATLNAAKAQGTQPAKSMQQGGPAITSLFQRNMARNNQIKNNISMNKMKLEDVINLSRGVNPFRMQPQGVYKSGGLIMEGGVSPSRAGFSRQPISGASSTGPLGPRRTEISDYNNGGVRSVLDLPSNEYVPISNMVPIQAEIGEMIVLPTGDLMPVMARKRHHQMKDDEVTDITPENSYILSAHGEVRINRDEADLLITETGVKPYRIGTKQNPPTEKTLASIMTKRVMRPAEVAKRINSLFPVVSTENPFELAANVENKINRKPYLEGLIQLSEIDKLRKGLSDPAQTDVEQAAINQGSPMLARQGGRAPSKPGVVKAQNNIGTGSSTITLPPSGGYLTSINPSQITMQNPTYNTAPVGSSFTGYLADNRGISAEDASGALSFITGPANFAARLWAAQAARNAEKQGIARERGIYDEGFNRMSGLMGAGTAMEAAMLLSQNPRIDPLRVRDQEIRQMITRTPSQMFEANYNRSFANLPDYTSLGRMGIAAQNAAYAKSLEDATNYSLQSFAADTALRNQQLLKLNELANQQELNDWKARMGTRAAENKILSGLGNVANRYTQGQMNLTGQRMGADIGLSRAEQASKTGLYGNRVNAFTTFTSDLTAGADDLMKLLKLVG